MHQSECDTQIFFENRVTHNLSFCGKCCREIFIDLITKAGFESRNVHALQSVGTAAAADWC